MRERSHRGMKPESQLRQPNEGKWRSGQNGLGSEGEGRKRVLLIKKEEKMSETEKNKKKV